MAITLSQDLLDRIGLSAAVTLSASNGVEHFPPLSADECLSGSASVVAAYLKAKLRHGYGVSSEIIGYPRRKFGIRPVIVASLAGRSLYKALVRSVSGSLPESSRGDEKWQSHTEFGLNSSAEYVVEADIASCYEYVQHGNLLEELVLRTMDPVTPTAIVEYLSELTGQQFGLPQLSEESDRLADVYLDVLSRRLQRDRYEISRFADDFRILAERHEHATLAIENFSEYARDLGLVLSTEKTSYYRRATLQRKRADDLALLRYYFDDMAEQPEDRKDIFFGLYLKGDSNPGVNSAGRFASYRRIIQDWKNAKLPFMQQPYNAESLQRLIPFCLAGLRDDEEDLDPDLLRDIVYDNATRIESVIKYIIYRNYTRGPGRSEDAIAMLMDAKQQSAWAKLWLILAASRVNHSQTSRVKVTSWLQAQTSDRHELVRGEAAWALVRQGGTTVGNLLDLYVGATELTRPLLAAGISRCTGVSAPILSAVEKDGPLMKEAIKWAHKSET